MAKAIRIDDPAQARAILQRYTGNAEAQAALADLDAQEQTTPAQTPTAPTPKAAPTSRQPADKARAKLARNKLRAFGSGGVAGDYRTMVAQRQLQESQAHQAEMEAQAQAEQQRETASQQASAEAAEQHRAQGNKARGAITSGLARLGRVRDQLNARADRIPTPGGLASLFIALLLLVFAFVPVVSGKDAKGNPVGYTRLALLWLTIRGQTALPHGSDAASAAGGGNAAAATSTSGAQTAPGTGGLMTSLRARSVPAVVQQDGATLARIPAAPAPQGGPLAGPWTFPTRWGVDA